MRGQIYVPTVNWFLMFACIALVCSFGSSSKLAAAYGIAVTLKMAEMQVSLRQTVGLSQSRHGWMNAKPPRERVDQVIAYYSMNK
jgi:KUP system potassium uptake protein